MSESFGQGRLPLGATLRQTIVGWPQMMRGAGPVLLLLTLMMVLAALIPASGLIAFLRFAFVAVLFVAAFGALTRIGVASDLASARAMGLGRGGFQWRRVEARLAGAILLILLFMVILFSLLALTALALFGAAGLDAEAIRSRDWAAVGPVWKIVLLSGVGVVVVGAPILMAVRLSLFAQATVGRGRMMALGVTSLTNGTMVPLLVGELACKLPMLLVLSALVAGGAPMVVTTGVGIVMVVFMQMPLLAGFLGAAYRRLETEPFEY